MSGKRVQYLYRPPLLTQPPPLIPPPPPQPPLYSYCTPTFTPYAPRVYPICTPTVPSLHYCMQTRWSDATLGYIRMVRNDATKYARRAVVDKFNAKQIITMPYKYKRVCPICQRPNVIHLSSHLAMVHRLSATESSPYLKRAVHLFGPKPNVNRNQKK